MRVGGAGAEREPFEVEVAHPLTGEPVHRLVARRRARSPRRASTRALWRRRDGGYAHHLLDPPTGRPAWTGLIGVTALAPPRSRPRRSPRRRCCRGPAARPCAARRGTAGCSCTTTATSSSSARSRAAGGATGRRHDRRPTPSSTAGGWPPRASGLVALVLVTASVGSAWRWPAASLRRPASRATLTALHEHAALPGLVAIGVHGVTLLGDPWLHPGVAGVTVPFTMGYRPVFTGLGIVGGYLAALLGPDLLRPPAHRRAAVAQAAPRTVARLRRSASSTRSAPAPTRRRPGCARSCSSPACRSSSLFVLRVLPERPRRARAARARRRPGGGGS